MFVFFRVYEDGKPVRVKDYFPWSTQGRPRAIWCSCPATPAPRSARDGGPAQAPPRFHAAVFAGEFPLRRGAAVAVRRPRAGRDAHGPKRAVLRGQLAQGHQRPVRGAAQRPDAQGPRGARGQAAAADHGGYHAEGQVRRSVGKGGRRQKKFEEFERPYMLLEVGDAFQQQAVQDRPPPGPAGREKQKPNADGCRSTATTALASLELQLFSPAPIHAEVDAKNWPGRSRFLAENLGGDAPAVRRVLDGKSSGVRAAELVGGTKLADPAERRRVAKGAWRRSRNRSTADSTGPPGGRRGPHVAQAFRGGSVRGREAGLRSDYGYPPHSRHRGERRLPRRHVHAAAGLRRGPGVSRGTAATYRFSPPSRRLRAGGEAPQPRAVRLPASWLGKREQLDGDTPFNFVSTADTIGGTRAARAERAGELVGINFDRNRHGLVRNFLYTDEMARHVAVHCRAVLERWRSVRSGAAGAGLTRR